MMRQRSFTLHSLLSRPALSMVEVAFATVLVGVVLVVAMDMVGASGTSVRSTADRTTGARLADQLMSEILMQSYEEPDDTPAFGRESTESGGDRANYDDVDDYHDWTASPPENKDGSLIPDRTGWRRSVTVQLADPSDLAQASVSDVGLKKITVTVSFNDVVVASLLAIRADTGGAL